MVVTSFGSPFSRDRSNPSRTSHRGDPTEDDVIVSERRSSTKKPNGTPMKTLIAQEMSKEMNTKHSSPSVVAKLMGLDAFPELPAVQRNRSRSYSDSHLAAPLDNWQRVHELDMPMQREIHQCPEQRKFEDVVQVWKKPEKEYLNKKDARAKRRHNDRTNEKKMELVRQKFIEAKRLSTDAKLRQSKQFRDALEVLYSNKDLFLKFLQESNSMFPEHQYDESVPRPSETKRITVIKPSEIMDSKKEAGLRTKNEKHIKKALPVSSPPHWSIADHSTQLARIVLLKPGNGMQHEAKSMLSTPSSSPRKIDDEEFYAEPADDESLEYRESEKESTIHTSYTSEDPIGHETSLSSVFSNGYTGDESSFHKSEKGFAIGDLSDSEVMSPSSKQSWVYNNRFDSPCSSSFSHASRSPESSVCREAKRRLSERWALMAANRNSQEQRHVRRSSSTLGEMLALSNFENFVQSKEEDSSRRGPKDSASCSMADIICDITANSSSGNLLRSKSLPASSNVLGDGTTIELSDQQVGTNDTPKELPKAQTMKSPRRGNIWSLLFSRNRKSNKDKSSTSRSKHDHQEPSGTPLSSLVTAKDDTKERAGCSEDASLPTLQGSWSNTTSPDLSGMRPKHDVYSNQAALLATKSSAPGHPIENPDQPSPVSVLEALFQETECVSAESCDASEDKLGAKLSTYCKSSLVDKSPPIGSIARTLSWDDSCADTTSSSPLEPSSALERIDKEEREWFSLVQSLLSEAGLHGDIQTDSFLARWHSPDSPLDPLLRNRHIDQNGERSTQKLVFDCVNAALVHMTRSSDIRLSAIPCCKIQKKVPEGKLSDQVWAHIKELFSFESRCVSVDTGEDCSFALEMLVRKEVVGLGWVDHMMNLETNDIAEDIEGKLLEELVEQAVADLVGRVW